MDVTTGGTQRPGGSSVVTSTAITAGTATVIEMAALPLPLAISLAAQSTGGPWRARQKRATRLPCGMKNDDRPPLQIRTAKPAVDGGWSRSPERWYPVSYVASISASGIA